MVQWNCCTHPPIKKLEAVNAAAVLYPSARLLAACMQCWLHVQRRDPGQEARRSEGSLRPAARRGAGRRPAARSFLDHPFFPASKGCLLQRHSFGPALTAAYALFPVPDSYYSALCMLHCLPVAEYATHVVLPTTYVLWPYGNARVRPSLVLQKPKQKILKLNKEKILAF